MGSSASRRRGPVVADNDSTDADLKASDVGAMLARLFGDEVHATSGSTWSGGVPGSACWFVLLSDAGPERCEDGEPPEQALEVIKPLADLGYSGTLNPDRAAGYLRAMATLKHARFARRSHPDGSGRIAIAAIVTLYLAELDDEELVAAVEELATVDATGPRPT